MRNIRQNNSPVIIGGSGGSGTRAVAEILIRSGFYLGQDLNKSNDNLLFSYLFKRPSRFGKDLTNNDSRLNELFELHEKLFLGHRPNKIQELRILVRAGKDHIYVTRRYNRRWVLKRTFHILLSKSVSPTLWGWKEPHTGYFLDAIHSYYPSARYILVIRNGLDMAYSKNVQQLKYWSEWFEITPCDLSPRNKFEYWYRYNKHIMERARKLFADKFLVIKLEDLCLNRQSAVKKLLSFVGVESENISEDILKLPELPRTYKRFLNYDKSWIDNEIVNKLAKLGYSISL